MKNLFRDNWGYLLFSAIFLILPTITGLIFYLTLGTLYQFEAAFVIFGCISLIIGIFRTRRRDTKNFKTNKTLHEDTDTDEYRQYRFEQWVFYITGLVDLGAGGILFLIFR